MIQLLVSINVAYITITRPVIKDRLRSLLYRPNSLQHRPRSLAEFTKTGRDPERPRSPATDKILAVIVESNNALRLYYVTWDSHRNDVNNRTS